MMKKKSRRAKSNQTQSTSSISGEKKPSGHRGRPRKNVPVTRDQFYLDNPAEDRSADFSVREAAVQLKHAGSKPRSAGRLTAALCRLCHGKFSRRSLRHAFTWPQDAADIIDVESEATVPSPLLFHTDFQRLVGVQLDRDPSLSEFICKKCHAKFYKCHSILIRFLQRVNLPPFEKDNVKKNVKCPDSFANHSSTIPASFTSDPKCLHSLVSWAHHHGEACRSCPDLKEVLEGQCWGSVKAVWGCVDGHSYIMDTRCQDNPGYPMNMGSDTLAGNRADGVMSDEEEERDVEEVDEGQPGGNGRIAHVQHSPAVDSAELPHWAGNSEDFTGHEDPSSPAPAQLEDRAASDLSDRAMSEDDFEESRKLSDDDLFEPSHSDKRIRKMAVPNKRRQSPKAQEEPKIKKKPGPKPGWKNKFKPKGEELPNIYKCPYQGCTAVYRAPDGLKKHIKEHHEEVRERPCPHPGCNKVFMIDRYLQRHVKLIHTEERNYICDQCGQTFKQRKHLSVHQMRHSGAKPLQCEVCGFQCRQRASLKYHMTKHKAEADLEFACLICEKRFEKAHNLNVHMSMVHPLTLVETQRGSGQQQQQQQQPLYDLHTISLTGEVVQQDQDR